METRNGLQIHTYDGAGYKPLVDFESWRVAMLNKNEIEHPDGITTMQRHLETDEVFVLLTGTCVLFIASNGDTPKDLHGELMKPKKLYNVPKGYWHNHFMDDRTSVLIVENQDTNAANSPHAEISGDIKKLIVEQASALMK